MKKIGIGLCMFLAVAIFTTSAQHNSRDFDETAGDDVVSECEIHHLQMERRAIPVEHVSSKVDFAESTPESEAYVQALIAEFPHARDVQLTPCPPDCDKCPSKVIVFECTKCRKAKEKWFATQQKQEAIQPPQPPAASGRGSS